MTIRKEDYEEICELCAMRYRKLYGKPFKCSDLESGDFCEEIYVAERNRRIRNNLIHEYRTCELVAELINRPGVKEISVDPYEKQKVSVEGPASVLIVID